METFLLIPNVIIGQNELKLYDKSLNRLTEEAGNNHITMKGKKTRCDICFGTPPHTTGRLRLTGNRFKNNRKHISYYSPLI